jgi:hypothetical protein
LGSDLQILTALVSLNDKICLHSVRPGAQLSFLSWAATQKPLPPSEGAAAGVPHVFPLSRDHGSIPPAVQCGKTTVSTVVLPLLSSATMIS